MAYYQAELLDGDGEAHTYYFEAPDLWAVAAHIHRTMMVDGDFYGHHAAETIELTVSELVHCEHSTIKITEGV